MEPGANGNQICTFSRSPQRLLVCAIAVMMAAAASAHAITTYSGVAVSSGGPINGWGVTDAYVSGMHHTAYVSTTLRSPKSRTSSSGWIHATSSVRADVSLSWDGTDLGSYVETSSHKYYCDAAMRYFFPADTQASANNAPARLVHYNYPPCAPNGVGPLQPLYNQSVVDCNGNVKRTGFDGVNRNLMYQLVDGTGTPFPGAYHIAESFSNFQKTPSNSGLGQPTALEADVPVGGLVGDYQYAGYPYPTVLGSNEHSSYTQSWTVKVGGTTYPLTTQMSISLGNFNGTLEDNVPITTP